MNEPKRFHIEQWSQTRGPLAPYLTLCLMLLRPVVACVCRVFFLNPLWATIDSLLTAYGGFVVNSCHKTTTKNKHCAWKK